MKNNKGLTIVELLAILVIMGIIASIAIFTISNVIQNSNIKADMSTLDAVNVAVGYYNGNHPDNPLSEQNLTEDEIIELLVDSSFLSAVPNIQSSNSSLEWSSEDNVFRLQVDGESLPLSPYGDTVDEIAPEIIEDMQTYYEENSSYGRTWGDYRYTDLGLNPDDWDDYILHISYTPSGSQLRLNIETGYEAVFDLLSGETYILPSRYNYAIIYSNLDGQWYYHAIAEENLIDITTLEIRLS